MLGRLVAVFAALVVAGAPLASAQNSTAPEATYSPPPEPTVTDPAPPPEGPEPQPVYGEGVQPYEGCCEPMPPKPFPDSACAQRMYESRDVMEAFFRSVQADWESLPRDLPPQELAAKVRAIHDAQEARLAELRAQFGECGTFLPPGVPMPPMTPRAADMQFHGEFRPGPAFPDDPRRREVEEKAHAIRIECEAKVRALFEGHVTIARPQPMPYPMPPEARPGEPYPAYPSSGPYPAQRHPDGGEVTVMVHTDPAMPPAAEGQFIIDGRPMPPPMPIMDADFEAKMREIRAECEARVRELFREHFDEEGREGMDERFGSLSMRWDEETQRIVLTGKFIALEGDPQTQSMAEVSCGGPLLLDRIATDGFLAEFNPEETMTGTALRVEDAQGQLVLSLHDNPRCTINAVATASVPAITLDLADYLDCAQDAAGDVRCDGGEGAEVVVLAHGGRIVVGDGNAITVYGRATLLLSDGSDATPSGEAYEAAVKAKRVGAEVRVIAVGQELAVDAAAIGDLEVDVEGEAGRITATIDSPAGEGKTVSLQIERELFDSAELAVRIDAIADDGAEAAMEAREADSLDDVLDPSDDGEAAEFWIVYDKNGFQVLVSFPHFSTKRVTIEPASSQVEEIAPRGIPSPALLLLLAPLGLAAWVARRRVA